MLGLARFCARGRRRRRRRQTAAESDTPVRARDTILRIPSIANAYMYMAFVRAFPTSCHPMGDIIPSSDPPPGKSYVLPTKRGA